ncbi:MAG: response regulator [Candidatus Omnitrophota bacterium]|nr:response regulator [Candidatus Omnitrophota bacterium]
MADLLTKKILAVDDEKEVLGYLRSMLQRSNYEVITATSGKEAVVLATEHKPDLILLDIVLPDIDGGDIASLLSKNPVTAKIPIIFLTGILKKEEEVFRTKTGKHLIIAKPVTKEKLLETIGKALQR